MRVSRCNALRNIATVFAPTYIPDLILWVMLIYCLVSRHKKTQMVQAFRF